jgi:hypothetical protein
MTFTRQSMAVMAACLLSLTALAAPVEIAGVKVDDPLELHGTKLQLNGAGIRYKAIFKVYVAGLYLGKKAGTPEEVLAAPGPKRISVTLLRDIDSNELGKGFTRVSKTTRPRLTWQK